MSWSEGDTWTLTLDLPAGKHEFKVASAPAKGNTSDGVWEDGPNRSVQASRAGPAGPASAPAGPRSARRVLIILAKREREAGRDGGSP